MADIYSSLSKGLTSPAGDHETVPSSSAFVLSQTSRGIWVGTGGTVECLLEQSSTVCQFTNVANGTLIPIRVVSFTTAGGASGIVALY